MSNLKKWNIRYLTLEDFESCINIAEALSSYTYVDTNKVISLTQKQTVYALSSSEAFVKILSKLSGDIILHMQEEWLYKAFFENNKKELLCKRILEFNPFYQLLPHTGYQMIFYDELIKEEEEEIDPESFITVDFYSVKELKDFHRSHCH